MTEQIPGDLYTTQQLYHDQPNREVEAGASLSLETLHQLGNIYPSAR
jgi:hypothetical protein